MAGLDERRDCLSRTLAAVMAGGAGERFWPLSRRSRPKPFISLVGAKPLVSMTIDRLQPTLRLSQIHVVLGEDLVPLMHEVMPQFPDTQLLVEPVARNTLGAMMLATARSMLNGDDALVAILPADHWVPDEEIFRQDFADAVALADDGYLVTMGIRPTRPETGYGYIHASESFVANRAVLADRFVEKPDRATAAEYLTDGRFYWNSGMFFFRQDRIIEEIRRVNPEWPDLLMRMSEALAFPDASRAETLRELLLALPNTSIDFAVMERARGIVLLPARYRWSDVGSWDTVADLAPPSRDLRTIIIGGEEADCQVFRSSDGPLVALVGIEDCLVAATKDAVLVVRRGDGQRVRDVVDELKDRGLEDLL
ncbi:MAG: mannose-1-phosphate guanylyltransferase [Pseudomonadota bacterium]